MFIATTDVYGKPCCIVDGVVNSPKISVSIARNGAKKVTFYVSHSYNMETETRITCRAITYGDDAEKRIRTVIRNGMNIILFGNYAIDTEKSKELGYKYYTVFVSTIIPSKVLWSLVDYQTRALAYEKQLRRKEKTGDSMGRIDYNYNSEETSIEDHML